MKKLVFLVLVLCGVVWANLPVCAVAPFENNAGLRQTDVETITNLFLGELARSGKLSVVDRNSFDRIKAQMNFQSSDWSDNNKVAEFGRALNANYVAYGNFMKLGDRTILIVNIINVNTTRILNSVPLQINDISELLNKMQGLVNDLLSRISDTEISKPQPIQNNNRNLASRWESVAGDLAFQCIIEIYSDNAVIMSVEYAIDTIHYSSPKKRPRDIIKTKTIYGKKLKQLWSGTIEEATEKVRKFYFYSYGNSRSEKLYRISLINESGDRLNFHIVKKGDNLIIMHKYGRRDYRQSYHNYQSICFGRVIHFVQDRYDTWFNKVCFNRFTIKRN